jgi:UDP-3-O-[3-hydroxymyristoyl] glucosamine N-acyltransferase
MLLTHGLIAAFEDIEFRGEGDLFAEMTTGFVWTTRTKTVVLATNRKYFAQACNNPAIAAIVARPSAIDQDSSKLIIVSPRAEEVFYYLHNILLNQGTFSALPTPEINATATIEDGARLGRGVRVGANAIVGANAVLQGAVDIAAGVRIEPGVVVGCDGLFAKRINGQLHQIRHYGGVMVGAGTYIHSGAVVARSAMAHEATFIGERVHIGVMCNVGHDVRIDNEVVLSSNTVVAGRARVGARAWIGASATVSNAVSVGPDARINIGAVCIRDVAAGAEVSGNFAEPHGPRVNDYLRRLRKQ